MTPESLPEYLELIRLKEQVLSLFAAIRANAPSAQPRK
jgi:hypothetical protein